MIDQTDTMSVVQKYRGNAVVIPVERANVAWPRTSTYPQRDISPSAMGKASSFALGLCLAQPETKVIVFDGDGSLEMNLGALVTIANKKPQNLYHFVLENGMYATTGGQPIPGRDIISFTHMARAAGYAVAYDFDNLEDLATQVEKILDQPGPALVCVKTTPNPRLGGQRAQEMSRRRRTIAEAATELRQDLGVA
jgi:thiamine pyrophosphate-dependent acetolactate synthase large subunit-like protein